MASLMVNILGAVIGIGGVVTAVTVPTVLLTSQETEQKENENSALVPQEQKEEKRDTQHQETQVPKTNQEKQESINFKQDCYGGFLKQNGRGELIICVDKTQNQAKPKPVFYLSWTEGGGEHFWKVKKIDSIYPKAGSNYEIKFELEQQNPKTLTVKDEQNLLSLQQADLPELQKRCQKSHIDKENYQLQCYHWNGKDYNRQALKNWFNSENK